MSRTGIRRPRAWGDENIANALKRLIPFLFPVFYHYPIFNQKKYVE
ncbi:Uncharacterized protein dnm_070110 [Desulfonema magnum]|uniref:Uncharacterized protein n=1 Tax=Desulfonema magnum TaxID=45655 RepID=A0A975BT22_9BACT|nr:Uncharacterized protein dnm_070110 [Desulfonema magnum]